MRNLLGLLMAFCSSFIGIQAQKHTLENGFDALAVKNYGIAKGVFVKEHSNYPGITAFGLAKLYYESKDLYNLDSAWYFIQGSLNSYPLDSMKLSQKKLKKLHEKGWTRANATTLYQSIAKSVFNEFMETKNLDAMTRFLIDHRDYMEYPMALRTRDSLWLDSCSGRDLFCWLDCSAASPGSDFREEMLHEMDLIAFQEWVKDNTEIELATFIQYHPESKFVMRAQDEIYHKYYQLEDTTKFKQFLTKYPSNRNSSKIWKAYFDASIGNYDSLRMVSFIALHPDYPFKNSVLQELTWYGKTLFPVGNDQDLYGFMDEEGNGVIPFQYDEVNEFHEGLAAVMKQGKYGVVNLNNEVVVDFKFETISDYQSGFAIVEEHQQFGLMDRVGKWIIQPNYSDLQLVFSDLLLFSENHRYGVMNTKEQKLLAPTFTDFNPLNDQFAMVSNDRGTGILDASLELLIPCEFQEIVPFSQGFLVKSNQQWGVVDLYGRTVVPTEFDAINSTPFPYLMVGKGTLFYHMDTRTWKASTAPCAAFERWREIASFDGSSFIINKKGSFVWVDSTLKVLKPLKMASIQFATQCIVGKQKSTDLWGILDRQGNVLTKFHFTEVQLLSNGFMKVVEEGKVGLYSNLGKLIAEPRYDNIIYWPEMDLFLTEINGLQGIMDVQGKVILPNDYSSIKVFSNQVLSMNVGNQMLYLNFKTGKVVKPKA